MRRLLGTLTGLITLSALAACGGGKAADAALRDAVVATHAAGAAEVRLDVDASVVNIQATGTVDFARGRSQMRSDAFGGTVEERVVDDTLYVRGTGWSMWRSAPVQTNDLKNPTAALGVLQRGTGAQRFGRERVADVATTHYRVRIALGDERVTADVWIDDDHRVRRLRARLPIPSSPIDPTATLTFTRFGVGTSITAPPAAEVMPAESDDWPARESERARP